ncbi:hypothetical protein [Macrococcoides caseolyticum]|uniref:hypothetical protein n=1 Tax=Macrococcoides caseolyticum TaxID=69966 RepID=UPI002A248D22|nr:hypothetical protein [Macrococcus caseolyticus]
MKIYNRDFIKTLVPHGKVAFRIDHASNVKKQTANGEGDVFILDVTLTNLQTGKEKILKNFHLFVSDNEYSMFIQFLNEYLNKINAAGFSTPRELVGISGTVDYYRNKNGYDDLRNWNFNIPSVHAHQSLQRHVDNNQKLQFNSYDDVDNPNISMPQYSVNPDEINTYDPSSHTDANIAENPFNDDYNSGGY